MDTDLEPEVDQPAALVEAVAPPAYVDSLHPDQTVGETKQQAFGDVQLQQGATFQAWPQGQVYQQPAQAVAGGVHQQGPVQYIAAPPVGGPGYLFPTSVAEDLPPHKAPHDFLILAMIITIICVVLNLLSLGFGIPAVIFGTLSKRARNDRQYSRAKTYGKYSLTMTIVNIIFTLCISLLITGLVVGCSYNYFRYGRYSYPGCYNPFI